MSNPAQYMHRYSALHRTDPRVKLITVVAMSVVILDTGPWGLLLTALALLAVTLSSKITPWELFLTSRPIWSFLAFLFLIYIATTSGTPLVLIPGLDHISREGLYLGTLQLCRFILLFLTASLLTMSTSLTEITMAVEHLLRPLKIFRISSDNVALMLSMALRFVPLLQREMLQVREAAASRGADWAHSRLIDKIRWIVYLGTPLTLGVMRRADELAEAMEARGYQPGPRTYLNELTLKSSDYYILGLVGILATSLFFLS
jgi:biotin transport system permease protein/energy-coupling factor transport system permease protein